MRELTLTAGTPFLLSKEEAIYGNDPCIVQRTPSGGLGIGRSCGQRLVNVSYLPVLLATGTSSALSHRRIRLSATGSRVHMDREY